MESTKIARRRRWVSWLLGIASEQGTLLLVLLYLVALFPSLLSLVGVTLTISGPPEQVVVPFLVFSLVLALWILSSLVRQLARAPFALPLFWSTARVTTEDGAVEVARGGRSSRLTRADLLGGWTMSHDGPLAVLQTRGQTVFIRTPDDEAADTLLEHVGAGPGRRALSMALDRSPRWSRWDVLASRLRSKGRVARGLAALLPVVALVGDGRATPEQRIAAAAALSARVDPEVASRLRIGLDGYADETVRDAIEKALAGELEAAEIERLIAAETSARAQ